MSGLQVPALVLQACAWRHARLLHVPGSYDLFSGGSMVNIHMMLYRVVERRPNLLFLYAKKFPILIIS